MISNSQSNASFQASLSTLTTLHSIVQYTSELLFHHLNTDRSLDYDHKKKIKILLYLLQRNFKIKRKLEIRVLITIEKLLNLRENGRGEIRLSLPSEKHRKTENSQLTSFVKKNWKNFFSQ